MCPIACLGVEFSQEPGSKYFVWLERGGNGHTGHTKYGMLITPAAAKLDFKSLRLPIIPLSLTNFVRRLNNL